ncbi:RNA-guided endonuclease InsQ/TnpB family protein [Bacillus sp. V33-4]|uniref:RNA-guided endonuclease InsQ/TnpB family protein n=1 Tax=Bacillus sp. V33-4 TaxID=2054169 RepID=UPI000C75935D|nr:RNA-guided endonuclease TnpB family protein [Bacillus sp. V33-4]PLR85657.1 transposase [Bacillus sp. V33-4]
MKLTHKFKIPYKKDLYHQLKNKQLESGKCWSDVVRYANDHYFTFKKWISTSELVKMTKNTYDLHSQTVQEIVAKYDENRTSTLTKRRNGDKNAKYPWRSKRFFSIPYKKSAISVKDNIIILKNSNYSNKLSLKNMVEKKKKKGWNETVKKQKDYIEIPNLAIENLSNISYAEIVYKNGSYWFHYVIEVEEEAKVKRFKPAGSDLGEIHSITLATEDKALVISGRAIRSIKQRRAKLLSELSKKISRCKKGSRQQKKYIKAKNRLKSKSDAQIEYLIHKSTKEAINFLVQEEVSDLVVGNPEGIEKNSKKDENKKKKNNKTRRQQLSGWSYGEFKQQLKYKSELKGINIHFVNESYTSQDCPFCGGRHKANGRKFKCSVHNTEIHRDVNGAQNICRKRFAMETKSVDVLYRQPVWYRRYLTVKKRKETSDKSIAWRKA